MINIIIIICCVFAGFAVGKFVEKRILEKGQFYQDLTTYMSLLSDNVNGRQLELAKFDGEFAQNCGRAFAAYLLNKEFKVHLSKAQKANIARFFANLDCVSSQSLVEHINYCSKTLTADCQNVLQNEVAKASVYAKLGMLLGAMVGILFV